MTSNRRRVLNKTVRFEPHDQARAADDAPASLREIEADVRTAWAAEIARRAEDATIHPEDEEDWRTALDEIRKEVLSR